MDRQLGNAETRPELDTWGELIDRLLGQPPGTWLRRTIGDRRSNDLSPELAEVFCCVGYVTYRLQTELHHSRNWRRIERLR
jgi:hypothetical protein